MKIAIVTGASSGIGKDFEMQIPKCIRGLDEIWVIARRRDRLKELKQKVSIPVRIFCGDLMHDEIYVQLKQALFLERPNIRMLVNAAGFGKVGSVFDIDKSSQEAMIDINCKALTKMTLICLPYCKKGSRIIQVASAAAFLPQPKFAVYAATKSYVLSFSNALSMETAGKGIIVTAVCPGPVATEFFEISGTLDNPLKDKVGVQAKDVVRQALLDSRRKKMTSVYGVPMKIAGTAAKFLPKRFLLGLMDALNKEDKK